MTPTEYAIKIADKSHIGLGANRGGSMQQYSEATKRKLADLYSNGVRVTSICQNYDVPRSTVYYWLKRYKAIDRTDGSVVRAQDVFLLETRLKRLEIENKILKECGCTVTSSRKERLEAISRLDGKYTIHALCRALDVLRSTYYHYKLRRPEQTVIQKEDNIYKPIIKSIFDEAKGRLGAKKIRVLMANKGYRTTAKRITRLMNEMSLTTISRKKKAHYNFSPAMKYKKNILQRNFNTDQPNKVWVSDITQISINYQPHYLCAVIDLFSRKVIAYKISKNQETSLVLQTFNEAYESRKPEKGVIFHSDQGAQYTSFEFKKHLRDLDVVQSFSNPGCPHDNAVAESFFRTLKSEEVYQNYYKTYEDLQSSINEYVSFFNDKRPHQRLGYLTPSQIEDKYYLK